MAARSSLDPSTAWVELARLLVADLVAGRRAERAPEGDEPSTDQRSATDRSADSRGEALEAFCSSLTTPHPFSIIVGNAGLSTCDAEVLALALGCESDPSLNRLLSYLDRDVARPRLTLGLVVELLDGIQPSNTAARSLAPDAPLLRSALIRLEPDGAFANHQVVVHPSLVWAVLGDDSTDPDLPPDTRSIQSADPSGDVLIVVTGGDHVLRRIVAAERCAGERFLVTPDPGTPEGWAAVVRDATITGRGVIVEVEENLPEIGRRWIERAGHLPWAISSATDLPVRALPRRPWVEHAVTVHEPDDATWAAAFGPHVQRTHRLTHGQLETVAQVFPAVGGDLDAAVRRLVSGRMEHLARRIRPTRDWDDIVLSPDRLELLHSIVDRYRFADRVYDEWGFSAVPSRGLVALFSGPSGTGKTMATEIIAGALGLDVFKLDLSAVVSKYIGETEKNLEEIFDAASAGNLVLFFDEADALFGKRSEVKDARDRYANIEVSYLLQRLERYDGLVILATNFEKNVDEAFLRRIHQRIEFAMPGVTERASIWRRNLPPGAPTADDIDIDWLAGQFEMSGGSIRNAAIHAAFLAAAADTEITMATTVLGVARELRKMGRLLKVSDFGDHFDIVAPAGD